MADEQVPASPPVISNDDALATAGAFFTTVENYLVGKAKEADKLPGHDEYSSLRGLISTTLATWRSGKPGGND